MTPGKLSEQLIVESHEFGQYADRLADILKVKPHKWLMIRKDTTSDTQAERKWSTTYEGIDETVIRLKMKKLLVSMSAIKTRLRTMSDEAKNIY